MMAERQIQRLHCDLNLDQLVLKGKETGKVLGVGSYGSVEEIEVEGMMCAGKKIQTDTNKETVAGRFARECQIMSDLRHPNITLFLGVCLLPSCQLPVLIMERLEGNVHDLLETVPNIPIIMKQSILEDTAKGLLYLHKHNPQIIHRDLTAKNVLLSSSMVAKITDFGNCRILNLQPGQMAQNLSKMPGTQVYMPPEASGAPVCYDSSLDIFSFGHLTLFVGLQVFPCNLLSHSFVDPVNSDRLIGRSEVKRREQYFDELERQLPGGKRHILFQLTKECLHNDPVLRPSGEQLVMTLQQIKADDDDCFTEFAKMDAVRQIMTVKASNQRKKEHLEALTTKDYIIQQLKHQLELTGHNGNEAKLHIKDTQDGQDQIARLEQLHIRELELKDSTILQHLKTIQQLHDQIEERDIRLKQVEDELRRCTDTLRSLQTPMSELKVPVKLKWRKRKNLPFEIIGYPQLVMLEDKLYIGGGKATSDEKSQTIIVYAPQKQESYNLLPPYKFKWFSMAVLNKQLLLVGGHDVTLPETGKVTNQIGVWNEQSKEWTQPFPPMAIACSSPAVATHRNRWLIVMGGLGDGFDNTLSRVEILDTVGSVQWHSVESLPWPCSEVTTATIGNVCYLVGGFSTDHPSKRVLSSNLDNLIMHSIASLPCAIHTSCITSPWCTLPDTPEVNSTAVPVRGALLAVGGSSSSAIYHYCQKDKRWIKAGELPRKRAYCACIVIPSGELFVVGGNNAEKQVDIASIQ